MNIIEALQKAENGALITNGFLKGINHFLKYIEKGIFYEYEIINNKPFYKFEIWEFSFAYIISDDWEILENNYFEK